MICTQRQPLRPLSKLFTPMTFYKYKIWTQCLIIFRMTTFNNYKKWTSNTTLISNRMKSCFFTITLFHSNSNPFVLPSHPHILAILFLWFFFCNKCTLRANSLAHTLGQTCWPTQWRSWSGMGPYTQAQHTFALFSDPNNLDNNFPSSDSRPHCNADDEPAHQDCPDDMNRR